MKYYILLSLLISLVGIMFTVLTGSLGIKNILSAGELKNADAIVKTAEQATKNLNNILGDS